MLLLKKKIGLFAGLAVVMLAFGVSSLELAINNVQKTTDPVAVLGISSPSNTIYGNPFSPNGLSNLRVGDNYNYSAAYRFRADHTGSIEGFRLYWIDSSTSAGYSDGNGGILQMSIQTDDGSSGHFPSSTVLGQPFVWSPNLTDTPIGSTNPGGNASRFQYFTLPVAAPVTQGQLYHLVFKNLDPSYVANFYSVDDIVMAKVGGGPPLGDVVQSGLSSTDWGVAFKTNVDPWTNASPQSNGNDHTPVLDLKWTDNHHLGNGYMEVWTGKLRTLTTSGNVRESITPNINRIVNKVSVAVTTVSSGTLGVKLETSTGTLIQQATTSFTSDGNQHWYSFNLPTTTLNAGTTYNLVLSTPTGSAKVYGIRDGNRSPFNFDASTTFSDGKAQEIKLGSWVDWEDAWSTVSVDYADLSFYFTLGSSTSSTPSTPSGGTGSTQTQSGGSSTTKSGSSKTTTPLGSQLNAGTAESGDKTSRSSGAVAATAEQIKKTQAKKNTNRHKLIAGAVLVVSLPSMVGLSFWAWRIRRLGKLGIGN